MQLKPKGAIKKKFNIFREILGPIKFMLNIICPNHCTI